MRQADQQPARNARNRGSNGWGREASIDPESAGLIWIDAQRAVIVRWEDEPVFDRLESGVPPRRRAVGSVRRGPARPYGGGRVGGHGTQERHLEFLQKFFAEVAERLADLDFVEVNGRGPVHAEFAELLETLARSGDGQPAVASRSLAKRPSDAQLAARFRRLVGEELPRRASGPYLPLPPDRTASGRVRAAGREGFRNPRPRHLPERQAIELEIEMMLAQHAPV